MNQQNFLLLAIILNLLFVIFKVEAQNPNPDSGDNGAVSSFQPSLAVVIGILSVMFSLTFLLLMYAKFCHDHRGVSVSALLTNNPRIIGSEPARSGSGLSGIDKKVIESLPFFKFSSLRGSRGGLECAVCLSKFEDIEVLRLLPKCKHAFHIGCVDLWLEKHSSCPLCRCKVSAEDATIFGGSVSLRFSGRESEVGEDSNIELFVQREEEEGLRRSSRFSVGSSFRRIEEKGLGIDQGPLIFQDDDQEVLLSKLNQKMVKNHYGSSRIGGSFRRIFEKGRGMDGEDQEIGTDDCDRKVVLHKVNHEIVLSDAMLKNRWSNVSSSDLMFLSSEMLNDMSSKRFSELGSSSFSANDLERKVLLETKMGSSISNPILPITSDSAEKRSVSDITSLSRFGDRRVKNKITRENYLIDDQNRVKEARIRNLWLQIARKTVEWFASREKRTQPETTSDV